MAILSSGRITASNIAKQSFANVYNLINDRDNVTDPNDLSGDRKFVHVRIPDIDARNFPGFPFIIVSRTSPNKQARSSGDLTKSFIDYSIFIGIYSQDSDSDSLGNPSGSDVVEQITDSIIATLDSATNQKTLAGYGMGRLSYDIDVDEDKDFTGKRKTVYITEFEVRFDNNFTKTT